MTLRSLRGQTAITGKSALVWGASALVAAFTATAQGQDKTPKLNTSYYAELGAGAD